VNNEGKIKQFYNFINAVKDEANEDSVDEQGKKIPEGKQILLEPQILSFLSQLLAPLNKKCFLKYHL